MSDLQIRSTTPMPNALRRPTRSVTALPIDGYARFSADHLTAPDGAHIFRVPSIGPMKASVPALVQATVAAAPTIGTAANGRRYFHGNGAQLLTTPNDVLSLTSWSLAVVASATGTLPAAFGALVSSAPNATLGISSGRYFMNGGTVVNGPLIDANVHVLVMTVVAGAGTLYVDGIAVASGAVGPNALTELRLFNAGTGYVVGDIYDVDLFFEPLSASNTDRVTDHFLTYHEAA
jgi:hypothetical protein